MKKLILSTATLFFVSSMLFTSCRKEKKAATDADETPEQTTHASDQSRAEGEIDNALDEANSALSYSTGIGKVDAQPVCGATVDTSQIASKIVVINYDGTTNCNGRIRSGQIKIQLMSGTHWKNAGSRIDITFSTYKVTRTSDNKSLTFNGLKSVTNVTGGTVATLLDGGSLTHKIRSNNLSITFDDGTVRSWSVARQRIIALNSGVYSLTITGDTAVNGASNVVMWGTNRNNKAFTTSINSAVKVNSTCGWYKPTAGLKTHVVATRTLQVTFGVDASGNQVSSGCAYGYKLNWTKLNGQAGQAIVSY